MSDHPGPVMDPASIKNLTDPRLAEDLAAYHDDTARRLRDHAAFLRRSKTLDLARKTRQARAGRVAYSLIENGMDRDQAIRETSRECTLHRDLVAAALGRLETYLAVKREDRLKRGVRRLADLGYSCREIEAETGVPKSTAARWIRDQRAAR